MYLPGLSDNIGIDINIILISKYCDNIGIDIGIDIAKHLGLILVLVLILQNKSG